MDLRKVEWSRTSDSSDGKGFEIQEDGRVFVFEASSSQDAATWLASVDMIRFPPGQSYSNNTGSSTGSGRNSDNRDRKSEERDEEDSGMDSVHPHDNPKGVSFHVVESSSSNSSSPGDQNSSSPSQSNAHSTSPASSRKKGASSCC